MCKCQCQKDIEIKKYLAEERKFSNDYPEEWLIRRINGYFTAQERTARENNWRDTSMVGVTAYDGINEVLITFSHFDIDNPDIVKQRIERAKVLLDKMDFDDPCTRENRPFNETSYDWSVYKKRKEE
jgi:hypothetical protein